MSGRDILPSLGAKANTVVSTLPDSTIAAAALKAAIGFDTELAYEAVSKDTTVPLTDDNTTSYSDRYENVGHEVHAG
ncbi:hypothetical protein EI94DRAFT_1813344 [Lactarius quietus]|nr:hypothetical protein EI94DRAFT_1813344 [Lactarius quietus]